MLDNNAYQIGKGKEMGKESSEFKDRVYFLFGYVPSFQVK